MMIAGITGHQRLGARENIEWVNREMGSRIDELQVTRGLTSLAKGSDQIFTRLLSERKIPYQAVIPCNGYESAFETEEGRSGYRKLLRDAAGVKTLDFPEPCRDAFYEAGRSIVSQCDVLFAVWDGEPAPKRGSTADIVMIAFSERRKIIHLNPAQMTVRVFAGAVRPKT